jgi:hypothetical protein
MACANYRTQGSNISDQVSARRTARHSRDFHPRLDSPGRAARVSSLRSAAATPYHRPLLRAFRFGSVLAACAPPEPVRRLCSKLPKARPVSLPADRSGVPLSPENLPPCPWKANLNTTGRRNSGALAPPIEACENPIRFRLPPVDFSFFRQLRAIASWRYRLTVRTVPSQGTNPGSIPGIATKLLSRREPLVPI